MTPPRRLVALPVLLALLALQAGSAEPFTQSNAQSGGQSDAQSAAQTAPTVTLLYQNFPNPFPSATASATCIWFDVHLPTLVRLSVHDIRGARVRTIVPSFSLSGFFLPGRYGRGPSGTSGCDSRFTWDGRADDGSVAPTGVYLIRLQTDYTSAYKKAVFRGF